MAIAVADSLQQSLESLIDDGDFVGRPVPGSPADFVIVSKRLGVCVLVTLDGTLERGDEQRLAAAVDYYRETVGVDSTAVRGLFLAPLLSGSALKPAARAIAVTRDDLAALTPPAALSSMPARTHDDEFERLVDSVFPAARVPLVRRFSDSAARENDRVRVHLDEEQIRLATHPLVEALHITGGAGSGKTIVLVARTRWVASTHPEWNVLLLCYNEALRKTLEGYVADVPNVEVRTFRDAAWRAGAAISEFGHDAEGKTQRSISRAIQEQGGRDGYDAILIDEAQDFAAEWLAFASTWVRPGRGGLTLASDSSQAVYGHGTERALEQFVARVANSATFDLAKSYRTTREILEVAVAATGASHSGASTGLAGTRVQVIWAPSLAEQSRCIAWEINHLLADNEMDCRDIAVLFANRFVLNNNPFSNHLTTALNKYGVPYSVIAKGHKTEDPGDALTITTFHSAKGKEFGAVFVLGVESLKISEPCAEVDFPSSREVLDSRAAYVAMTRARNTLMVTYSKPNAVIERLLDLDVEISNWPADYPEL